MHKDHQKYCSMVCKNKHIKRAWKCPGRIVDKWEEVHQNDNLIYSDSTLTDHDEYGENKNHNILDP